VCRSRVIGFENNGYIQKKLLEYRKRESSVDILS